MSSSRLVKAMLEYGVNEQSIRRVVDSTRRVDSALRDVQATAGRTGLSSLEASRGFARMASAEDRAAASAVNLEQRLTATQRAAQRLNAEMQRGPAGGSSGGDALTGRGGRLATFGRELRALPAVGIPGAGFSTDVVGKIINTIGNTGVSLTALATAAGILAPAAIAGAVALDRFSKEIEQYKSRLDAAIKAQRTLSEARAELTEEEARAALEQATRDRDRLQQDAQRAREAADRAFADVQANFGDPLARLLDSQTGVAQLRQEAEDLTAQYQEQADLVTGYTNDLEANAYATNNAAEAERQLIEARQRSAELNISSALTARQQSRTMSSEDARQRLEDLQFEFDLLNGSSVEGAAKRLQEISYEMIRLEQTVIPAVAAREREEQATQNLTDRIEMASDATERHAAETEKLADIQQKISDAQADSTAKLAQIEADLRDKRADIETNYQDKLADIEQGGADKRLEINDNYHERVRKANALAANALLFATGERDALAAFMADQNRKQEINDAQRERKKAESDLKRDLKRQTDLAAKERSRQLEIAAKAAQRAVEIEVARANAQLSALQQTFNAQQAIVADWAQKVINYTYAVSNAVNGLLGGSGKGGVTTKPTGSFGTLTMGTKPQVTSNFVPTGGFIGSAGGSYGGYGGGIAFGGFFARGGYTPGGRAVMVGEQGPEMAVLPANTRVYSNSETRRMMAGGGITIPITINGTNKSVRQIEAIAAGKLRAAFREAGWG